MTLDWLDGRRPSVIMKDYDHISYTYNADGLRNSKYVTGVTTDYYWLNGILQAQKTGSEYIVFLHDENGVAYGFLLKNGATEEYYYYVFNLQGDVIGILDSNGTQVVEYTYNPWGEILSITGTMAETIGQKNPLRYRGYYYDNETGFYYLRSRYYDPVVCRFINADGLLSTGTGVLGYNMFTYCNNNPILLTDSTGSRPVVGASIKNETTAEREASCAYMNMMSRPASVPTGTDANNTGHSSGGDLTNTQMHDNAEIIHDTLINQGWTSNAICAVLGNMQAESVTINPGKYQDGGPGYGLVQWDPASKYLNWAAQNGYADDSLQGQINFLTYSMRPGQGEWFRNPQYPNYYLSYQDFISSDASVVYLTQVFLWSYERPSIAHLDNRIRYSTYWYNYFN